MYFYQEKNDLELKASLLEITEDLVHLYKYLDYLKKYS